MVRQEAAESVQPHQHQRHNSVAVHMFKITTAGVCSINFYWWNYWTFLFLVDSVRGVSVVRPWTRRLSWATWVAIYHTEMQVNVALAHRFLSQQLKHSGDKLYYVIITRMPREINWISNFKIAFRPNRTIQHSFCWLFSAATLNLTAIYETDIYFLYGKK